MAGPRDAAEPPSGGTLPPGTGGARADQQWHGLAALSSCPKGFFGRFPIQSAPPSRDAICRRGRRGDIVPGPQAGAEFVTRALVWAMRPRGAMGVTTSLYALQTIFASHTL